MVLFIAGAVTYAVAEITLAFAIPASRRHLVALYRQAVGS